MARRKSNQKTRSRSGRRGSKKYIEFESSRGAVVSLTAMPPMLMARIEAQVDEEFGEINPPTYTVEAIGGEPQVIEHTAKTVETPEEKEAWIAYKDRLTERQTEKGNRVMRALQVQCMEPVFENGDEEAWIKRQEYIGMSVPDDELDRKLFWIESEFIGSTEDMMQALKIPMELAGVDPEELGAAEKLFRGPLQEQAA